LGGKYYNRIVIPYYDREGTLIYFNCRALNDNQEPKYRGPPKELGIGKGDVIFMSEWPPKRAKLYLTEGEFDALSLYQSGFYSAALGGKEITEFQCKIIRPFTPIISVDNDEAGRKALKKIGDSILEQGKRAYYIRPPQGHKDWNALLEEYNDEIVREYIKKCEKEYTQDSSIEKIHDTIKI
jgi:DNA primase